MGGALINLGRWEKCLQILVGRPEGKRSFERPSRDGKNIVMDHKEVGSEVMDLIYLTLDGDQWWALLNTIFTKGWEFLY
jgi:hypothetical protein